MSGFSRLKNRHLGQRCVIVCNGPSLNKMDLSFLRNEITIGLNKIFLGTRRFGFYPRYYVAVNKKVLEQSESEIKSMTSIKFLSNRCSDIFEKNATTYILDSSSPQERFCKNIEKGIEEGWTVTYAALQVAYYLGFKEVVIIGMDHRYVYEGEPNEERLLIGEDTNHFAPSYFSGVKWDNPDLAMSEESYSVARHVFEESDRRIIDATVDGACTIFEKRDYRDIFQLEKTADQR